MESDLLVYVEILGVLNTLGVNSPMSGPTDSSSVLVVYSDLVVFCSATGGSKPWQKKDYRNIS